MRVLEPSWRRLVGERWRSKSLRPCLREDVAQAATAGWGATRSRPMIQCLPDSGIEQPPRSRAHYLFGLSGPMFSSSTCGLCDLTWDTVDNRLNKSKEGCVYEASGRRAGAAFLACRGGAARHIRGRDPRSGRRERVTTHNLNRKLTERLARRSFGAAGCRRRPRG